MQMLFGIKSVNGIYTETVSTIDSKWMFTYPMYNIAYITAWVHTTEDLDYLQLYTYSHST